MKLKRWVGLAVTAAAAVLLLSACTSSEQKNTENTQETDSVSVGTVVNHESVSQEQTSASHGGCRRTGKWSRFIRKAAPRPGRQKEEVQPEARTHPEQTRIRKRPRSRELRWRKSHQER